MKIRALVAALALLTLGGCGFTPLYGDQGVVKGLRHVQVETPQTRTGYLLKENLQDDLAVKREEKPEYRLVVELTEIRLPRGLRQDATADRYETRLKYTYTLTRLSTGEVVMQRSSVASVITDASAQAYSEISSQSDAQERVAWEASQFIKTQVLRAIAAQ